MQPINTLFRSTSIKLAPSITRHLGRRFCNMTPLQNKTPILTKVATNVLAGYLIIIGTGGLVGTAHGIVQLGVDVLSDEYVFKKANGESHSTKELLLVVPATAVGYIGGGAALGAFGGAMFPFVVGICLLSHYNKKKSVTKSD